MSRVDAPFSVFTGLDNRLLDNGYVWFGQENQDPETSPIPIFADEAMTIPLAQPVRTTAGVLTTGSNATNVYVGGHYSIRVRNTAGAQVVYLPKVSPEGYDFSEALASGIGASKIGFQQAGTGAIVRTVQAKAREQVSVFDFGAVGDGVSNDTAPIQAAINYATANRCSVFFPAGTYLVTTLTVSLTQGPFDSTFHLYGDGRRASRLRKFDNSNSPILTIIENFADPSPSQVDVLDLEITGNGNGTGLLMQKVSGFSVRRVMFNNCNRACDLSGCLIGEVSDCDLNGSGIGIRLAKDSFFSGANHITVRNCRIKGNTIGAELVRGSRITFVECDVEANGTLGNQATGAVKIRSGFSSDIGFSGVNFRECWFESNRGWTIDIEDQGGNTLILSIGDCKIIDNDPTDTNNRRAIRCAGGGQMISINNTYSPSPGDLWQVTCTRLSIKNSVVNKMSGVRSVADDFVQLQIGNAPVEGNRQSDLHIGGERKTRWSWGGGAGFYEIGGNGLSGDLDLTGNGAARVNAPGIKFNISEVQVGGQKVLGARQAAIGNPPNDLGAHTTTFQLLLNALRAHGIIAS
jgi:hypothetical protein